MSKLNWTKFLLTIVMLWLKVFFRIMFFSCFSSFPPSNLCLFYCKACFFLGMPPRGWWPFIFCWSSLSSYSGSYFADQVLLCFIFCWSGLLCFIFCWYGLLCFIFCWSGSLPYGGSYFADQVYCVVTLRLMIPDPHMISASSLLPAYNLHP